MRPDVESQDFRVFVVSGLHGIADQVQQAGRMCGAEQAKDKSVIGDSQPRPRFRPGDWHTRHVGADRQMYNQLVGEPGAVLLHPGINGEEDHISGSAQHPELPALPGRHHGKLPANDRHEVFVRHPGKLGVRAALFDPPHCQRQVRVQAPFPVTELLELKQHPVRRVRFDKIHNLFDAARLVRREHGLDADAGDRRRRGRTGQYRHRHGAGEFGGEMSRVVPDAVELRRQGGGDDGEVQRVRPARFFLRPGGPW